MPIHATPAGGWEVSVCVRCVRLHRRLPPGTPARDAKRVEAELRVAAERVAGERIKTAAIPGDPALNAVMALYLAHAAHLRSPETAKHHAQRIEAWTRKFRASQARECAAVIVADMLKGYKPATINRSLGALKKALRLAWERGETPEDYGSRIRRLPENNARDVYLTMEQVAKLADHASESVRAAIWIALLTGCRRGEVLAIRTDDIGPDIITIRAGNTKTLRTRTVPIVPALRPWLKFVPLPINYEGLKSGFARARVAASMPGVHFHDLRHSCATILLGLGVPLDVVRDILGHSTIKTTERYAHALVHRQRDALQRLGELHQALTPAKKNAPRRGSRHLVTA
ncbi:MAG: site-specific integrase [Betaproteobacteria bacterium]|nr:site-specific integrase [Betaproteobacteria bacterium]